MSCRSYNQIFNQRNQALLRLAEIEAETLESGLIGVVFSKNRALQLYSLLKTYREHVCNPAGLLVIYTASNVMHEKSYEEVSDLFAVEDLSIVFIKEVGGFRETFLKIIDSVRSRNIFFLVDDIVFIRDVDLGLGAKIDTKKYVLSLRHSPYLDYSYTSMAKHKVPELKTSVNYPELLEFNWFESEHEWSDPCSLDGQILSTSEVKAMAKISDFTGPNALESVFKTFSTLYKDRLGLCYPESKLLNLPLNRVQTEVKNFCGDISSDYLLSKWNDSMTLDTQELLSHVPRSTHEEFPIRFRYRKN